jgi:hypothetical protein
METADEWAEHLGTVVKTEIQFFKLWQYQDIVGALTWPIDGRSVREVEADIAEMSTRHERLVGVLRPWHGTDPWINAPEEAQAAFDAANRSTQAYIRLIFRKHRPGGTWSYPPDVAFTLEDAMIQALKYPLLMRAGPVGPITEVKAALMTLVDAFRVARVGIPSGSQQRPLDMPVALVVTHGAFEVSPPGFMRDSKSSPRSVAHYMFDCRDGSFIGGGAGNEDIVLPGPGDPAPEV